MQPMPDFLAINRLYALQMAGYAFESCVDLSTGTLKGHRYRRGEAPDNRPFPFSTKEECEAAAWRDFQRRDEIALRR